MIWINSNGCICQWCSMSAMRLLDQILHSDSILYYLFSCKQTGNTTILFHFIISYKTLEKCVYKLITIVQHGYRYFQF